MKERQETDGSDSAEAVEVLSTLLNASLSDLLIHFPASVIERWIKTGIKTKIRRLLGRRRPKSPVNLANSILRNMDENDLQKLAAFLLRKDGPSF